MSTPPRKPVHDEYADMPMLVEEDALPILPIEHEMAITALLADMDSADFGCDYYSKATGPGEPLAWLPPFPPLEIGFSLPPLSATAEPFFGPDGGATVLAEQRRDWSLGEALHCQGKSRSQLCVAATDLGPPTG
jgi:hypothetical protein